MVLLINLEKKPLMVLRWVANEAILTKQKLNWPYNKFQIPNEIKHKWINVGKKGTKKRINWEKKFKGKKIYRELMSQFKSTPIKRDNKTLDFLRNLHQADKERSY